MKRLPVEVGDLLAVARAHGTTLAAEWAGISDGWVRSVRRHHDGYDRGRGRPSTAEVAAWSKPCPPGRTACARCRQERAAGSTMPTLTDEQRRMVEANVGLVGTVVYRWLKLTGQDADDAMQDGMLGLMRATQKYEPERGFTFSTYAMAWIRQGIGRGRELREGRNFKRAHRVGEDYVRPLSLDAVLTDDGADLHRLVPAVDAPERDAVEAVSFGEIGRAFLAACIDDLDRAIVVALADGESPTTIARSHDVARQTVINRIAKLRQKVDPSVIAA